MIIKKGIIFRLIMSISIFLWKTNSMTRNENAFYVLYKKNLKRATNKQIMDVDRTYLSV